MLQVLKGAQVPKPFPFPLAAPPLAPLLVIGAFLAHVLLVFVSDCANHLVNRRAYLAQEADYFSRVVWLFFFSQSCRCTATREPSANAPWPYGCVAGGLSSTGTQRHLPQRHHTQTCMRRRGLVRRHPGKPHDSP